MQEDELFADQYVKPALQRFVFKTLEDEDNLGTILYLKILKVIN